MKLAPFIIAAVLLTPNVSGAASGERVVPVGDDGEALIVPAGSPVHSFRHTENSLEAAFTGRFVLTGVFTYGCQVDCDGPVSEDDLALYIVPDPAMAARLPHWKTRTNKMRVWIEDPGPFIHTVVTPRQRAALLSGKLDSVTGRATIMVDRFQTAIACDSANYSARFVGLARPAIQKPVQVAGDYGCG